MDISQLVRERDGLYIIDGIRRVEALKHLGYVECPAEVLHGLTVEDEARIFVNMNEFHDEYDEEYEVYPDVESGGRRLMNWEIKFNV